VSMANEASLFAIVVKLVASQDATLPATQGHHAHAVLLQIIRAVEPELAAALHAGDGRKPFTVDQLRGTNPAGAGRIGVRAGQQVTLRFTLLDAAVSSAFLRRFLWGEARPTIRLGPAHFAVTEVIGVPDSHPSAGYASFSQLLDDAQAGSSISVEFVSPTAFSRNVDGKKRFWLYPDPESVFDSLSGAWNRFGGAPVERPVLRERLKSGVMVSSYHCRTRMLQYPRHRQVGFEGRATYTIVDRDQAFRRQLQALAALAFYAGVGYKTTMGMGQCRIADR